MGSIEIKEGHGTFAFDDYTLQRFLMARDNSPKKAFKFLKKHIAWRNKVLPYKIKPSEIEIPLRSGCWREAGFGKDGEPILLTEVKYWDPKAYDVDTYEKYIAWMLAKIDPYCQTKKVKGITIFDLEGWSVSAHSTVKATRMVNRLVSVGQDNAPESSRKLYILNSPWVFRAFFNLISKWLDPETKEKIQFLTKDKFSAMHEFIDPATLYERYGGTKKEEYPVFREALDSLPSNDDKNVSEKKPTADERHLHTMKSEADELKRVQEVEDELAKLGVNNTDEQQTTPNEPNKAQ